MCKHIYCVIIVCCINSFFSSLLFGQDSLQQKIALKEITLDAARIKSPKKILPFALTYKTFPQTQINNAQNSLQDYLQGIPGLFAQNTQNFAQDLRLSIRGFGARSAFGIRGIQLIVDGIPETTPDGQGQLDNLPLGLIESLTVLRGPASTFYGNAAGGVIQINTLSDFEDNFARFRMQGGSYSSSNLSATVGLKNNKTKAVFYQNLSQSDGYRDHSRYKQQVFNTRVWHDFSSKSKISFQFNYTNSPYAYDAGGINLESVIENRRQARPQNKSFKTFESVEHIKTGLQWEKTFGKNLSFSSYLFYANRDFKGRLPFEFGGLVDLVRDYYGGGAVVEYQPQEYHRIQFRVSFADQTDHRKRFKNIAGEAGDITLNQKELFDNKCTPVAHYASCQDVTTENQLELKAAVSQQPVSIAIEADSPQFQHYKRGIFDESFLALLENGEKKSVLTKKYHMTENEISNYMEFMNDSKTNSQNKNDNIRDLISILNEKLDRIEKKLLKIEEIDKYIYKKLKG